MPCKTQHKHIYGANLFFFPSFYIFICTDLYGQLKFGDSIRTDDSGSFGDPAGQDESSFKEHSVTLYK